MMFKYPRCAGELANDKWRLIGDIREVEWCKGYAVRHKGKKKEEELGRGESAFDDLQAGEGVTLHGHDSFHVQLEDPQYVKEDAVVGCIPAILEMRPECYEQLRTGEMDWIEMIVVMLIDRKGETREYAVHSGYVLNDDGKTVEKLFIPADVG